MSGMTSGESSRSAREIDQLRERLDRLAEDCRLRAEREALLTVENQHLARRLSALEALQEPPQRWRPSKRWTIGLVSALVVLVAAFPLVVLAADIFTDVPAGFQFHDQIEAIALAGITTGSQSCAGSGTRYCPNDPVDRKSMAAFMSRGFGRVRQANIQLTNLPVDSSTYSFTIATFRTGLPTSLLSGAHGYLKADVVLTIDSVEAQNGRHPKVTGWLSQPGWGTMTFQQHSVRGASCPACNLNQSLALTGLGQATGSQHDVVLNLVADYNDFPGALVSFKGDATITYFPLAGI